MESIDNVLVLLAVVRVQLLLAVLGQLELHLLQPSEGVRDRVADHRPRDLVLGAALADGLLRLLVVGRNVANHPHRLVQGAVLVVLGEGVLLEELLADHAGELEHDLVILAERVLAHELHDLGQVVLALQDLGDDGAEADELGVDRVEEGLERLDVLGVRDQPVDGREVLALRELLVKAPEDLHDAERGRRDGVGEVTTRGRDGADNRDGALAGGRAEAAHATGALVEGGQTGAEVCGVATVGRHLGQTTRNLTKSFGPARRRVGHHGDVLAHVAVVLGERDTRVDGGLTGGDGHVRSVGDERRALHDGLLAALDARRELGELHENLSHLIAALTAADVHNGVGVGVLGERLRNDGLAAAEGTGDGASAALHGGEEGVEDALARQQRTGAGELLRDGTGLAHGPAVHHRQALLLTAEVNFEDLVRQRVVASGRHPRDLALVVGREHHVVRAHERVLGDAAVDVTTGDHVADAHAGVELPLLVHVEGGDGDALRDEHGLRHLHNDVQRALDTVEDLAHDAGAKLERERLARAVHGIAHGEAARLLVDLDRRRVGLETDDLADELVVAHLHELVHGGAGHLLGDDDGTGDTLDDADVLLGGVGGVGVARELRLRLTAGVRRRAKEIVNVGHFFFFLMSLLFKIDFSCSVEKTIKYRNC
eukprot:PhM_4_TR4148/c1_g1_i1/m.22013